MRDLSCSQEGIIIGVSAGLLILGQVATNLDRDTMYQVEYKLNAVDQWARKRWRGDGKRPTNFLDNLSGSLLTPGIAACAIGLLDIDRREFSRDVPLFLGGIGATKGITDLVKALTSRPRPYMLDDDLDHRPDKNHYRSFFSGHASGAFYTATFSNKQFRRHMRQNWTADEYRVGRWISPAVTFGWASYVGYSRIHADKHYFTDVAVGALVGVLIAEIYYNLGHNSRPLSQTGTSSDREIVFTLCFPLP